MDQGLRSLPGEIQNQEQREEKAPSLRDHPAAPWAPAQPLGADPALPLLLGTLLCLSMNDPTIPPQEPRTEHFCPEPSKTPIYCQQSGCRAQSSPQAEIKPQTPAQRGQTRLAGEMDEPGEEGAPHINLSATKNFMFHPLLCIPALPPELCL